MAYNYSDETYNYLMEVARQDPAWIRVLKWAIQVHFNSPKAEDDGSTQDSHIGYYFDSIRFVDYDMNADDCEIVMKYHAVYRSDVKYGSKIIKDERPFTIEYHVVGRDEIKAEIRHDKGLADAVEKQYPSESIADVLHEIAENCVYTAKVYFKNQVADARTFSDLNTFGKQLVDSDLFPSAIKRLRVKNQDDSKGTQLGPQFVDMYTITIPSESFAQFQKLWSNAQQWGVEVGEEDQKRTIANPEIANTKVWNRTKNDDGSWTYTMSSQNKFVQSFVDKVSAMGLVSIDNVTKQEVDKRGDLKSSSSKKSSGSRKASNDEPATAATLAFDAESFERGVKLANALVKRYTLTHPKGNASLDVDDNAQSVTFNGMNKKSVEEATGFLKSKGLTFSEM